MTPEECKRLRGLMYVASGDLLIYLVLNNFETNTTNGSIATFEAGQKLRAEQKGLLPDTLDETVQKLYIVLGNADEPELLTEGYPVFQMTFLAAALNYLERLHGTAWTENFKKIHSVKISVQSELL
jgi:hypothetical protein